MKNTPRYYVTASMLGRRGACFGSQVGFEQLFRVGPEDHVELTNPATVKKLLESGEFRHRLDWPARRLYNELPTGTKLEKQAGKLADQLDSVSYGYGTALTEGRRKELLRKATKLFGKTGQLWDRYKAGER